MQQNRKERAFLKEKQQLHIYKKRLPQINQ